MKNSVTDKNKKTGPGFSPSAARRDGSTAEKPATSLNETPLADLMLHPEKVATVLEVTAVAGLASGPAPATGGPRGTAPKKRAAGGGGKPARPSTVQTEFHLAAPLARSVKLAADFTDWEKSSLDLTRSEDGVWRVVVPLPPGDHSYRFLVDGEWCDDPQPAQWAPNPYGTRNAVVKVT